MTARAPIDDRAYAAFFGEPSVLPPPPVATAPATPTAPVAGGEVEREVGELYGADRLAKFPKKQVVLFRSVKKAQDAEKVLGDLLVAVAPVNPDATNWKTLSGRSIAAVAAADQVEELAEYAVGVASSLKVVPVADAEWLNGDKADGAALLDMIKTRGVWKKEKPRTDGAKSPAGDNAPKPKEASSSPDAAEQAPVDAPQHVSDGEQVHGGDAGADGEDETDTAGSTPSTSMQEDAPPTPEEPIADAPVEPPAPAPAPAAAPTPAPAAATAAVPVAPTRTTTKRDAQAYSDGPVDADRVRDALSYLDPSCDRAMWVQIGMCIKNGLGEDGFDVWDQWSAQCSEKYNAKDAASTWQRSIKADGARTIASLFHWAKERGWKPTGPGKKWTKAEIEAHKAAQADRQCRQVEEADRQHAEDARRLAEVRDHWRSGALDPVDNDYVIKKHGKADGLRSVSWPLRGWSQFKDRSLDGWLMIPAYAGVGNTGDVMSIQFIGRNRGEKLNAPTPIKGYTFTVGELKKGEKAFIVEGIGHAWSMNIVTDRPAVVSFGAGSIEIVAAAVQKEGAIPVIVPDRGKEADAARIAARLGCWYAPLPEDLPIGSDVNDLHLARGDDAVRAVVDGAILGQQPKPEVSEGAGQASEDRDAWLEPDPSDEFIEPDWSAQPAHRNLPEIELREGERARIVHELAVALAGRAPYFRRDALLVRAITLPEDDLTGPVQRFRGAVVLRQATTHAVISDASRFANVVRYDARSARLVPKDLPDGVAASFCATAVEENVLPSIIGVARCPIMLEDGSLRTERGHDPATKLILAGTEDWSQLDVPEHPTIDDAKAALQWLLDTAFADFPFADQASRSVAVSALLTAVIRPAIPCAPVHAFSAPQYGAGKSLQAEFAAIVATGAKPSMIAPGHSQEEFEKRVDSVLIEGDPVVVFDNLSRPLTGDNLCASLTSGTAKVRPLGSSATVTVRTSSFWMATGQNLSVKRDMHRRTVISYIDAGMERPETRSGFKVANLKEWAEQNRMRILSAMYTMLRAHAQAGYPTGGEKLLGNFEVWSRRVANCLVWLGLVNPVRSQERLRADDPEIQNRIALMRALAGWQETRKAIGGSSSWTTSDLRAAVSGSMGGDTELSEAIMAGVHKGIDGMPYWARANRNVTVSADGVDYKLQCLGGAHGKVVRWEVVVVRNGQAPGAADDETPI